MATLLLSGIGTLVGGPLGGALGALVGQQVDQAIIGSKTRRGPRLKDLAVQASSYGAAIPRIYGRMRVAGSVIWATDLNEHREKQGGGKGRPKTVSYSYSSSFAVALASRPILGVGRIWADGNLLRGADGELKASGTLRIYSGYGDQEPDPLLAAAEGANCPAYRGCAYAVFEDLQLADFGNRIPSLTFEVLADDGEVPLATILADVVAQATVAPLPRTVAGFSIDGGSAAELIEIIDAALPLSCTTQGDDLLLGAAEPAATQGTLLPPPVPANGADPGADSVASSGFARRREALPRTRLAAVRYYDLARDFQPSVQRGTGRATPGQAESIDFPAALAAPVARELADAISQRAARPLERATYRIAELDPALSPGAVARLPGSARLWRIDGWEWTAAGLELELEALAAGSSILGSAADPGRASTATDLTVPPTELAAFELPWDGHAGGSGPALFAAASGASAGWRGAALFVEHPDGTQVPLGSAGRIRAVLGRAVTVLGPGSPLVVDTARTVEVQLVGPDLDLDDSTLANLALGANRALLGEEVIQFGRAEPLGEGRWRLGELLRGRGGTESAIVAHQAGERFVLLDDALIPLDPERVGDVAHARIAALGLADRTPITVPFALAGATLRPLSPVHGRMKLAQDGGLELGWTRRARGAWLWSDGVDAPLAEQSEAYLVTLGDIASPVAAWETAEPALRLSADVLAPLRPSAAGASFGVRQRGSRALSRPLWLGVLS